jgi:hypothetical protein
LTTDHIDPIDPIEDPAQFNRPAPTCAWCGKPLDFNHCDYPIVDQRYTVCDGCYRFANRLPGDGNLDMSGLLKQSPQELMAYRLEEEQTCVCCHNPIAPGAQRYFLQDSKGWNRPIHTRCLSAASCAHPAADEEEAARIEWERTGPHTQEGKTEVDQDYIRLGVVFPGDGRLREYIALQLAQQHRPVVEVIQPTNVTGWRVRVDFNTCAALPISKGSTRTMALRLADAIADIAPNLDHAIDCQSKDAACILAGILAERFAAATKNDGIPF